MTDTPVRVRIAPSPSGYLHVGTARTAIFNYLFARRYGGKFLIRIEDTDVARSDAALIQPILAALEWLGMKSDEEIVYQSQRIDRYQQYATQVLDNGHAYRCFLEPDEVTAIRDEIREAKQGNRELRQHLKPSPEDEQKFLAEGKPFTIRLEIPDATQTFNDMVAGEVSRSGADIEDFVIARSDGSATYNLAVVIDDHEMGISHVIRGNDHVTNTFKQILLYRALGWEVPAFGHVPLILRPDKKKVSKRLGDKDVGEYRNDGFLPEALFNYLSLLGWSPKTDQEIYTVDELIELFDDRHFNNANAVFDEEKLEAFNYAHIQKRSDHELAELVAPMFVEAGLTTRYWLETRWDYLRLVVRLLKERVRRLTDFVSMGGYFFEFDFTYDEQAAEKNFTADGAAILTDLADRFDALESFNHDDVEQALNEVAEARGVKRGKLIHPTRLAVSGVPSGPGLFDLLVALGKEKVVERMRRAIDYIRNQQSVENK